MPNTPPKGLSASFQRNTITPPVTIPATAPAWVVRFQNREKSMMGPNTAPKPAQAKETMVKMTLFSSMAMITPTTAISSRMIRLMVITCLSEASFLRMPLKMFRETAEAAISR